MKKMIGFMPDSEAFELISGIGKDLPNSMTLQEPLVEALPYVVKKSKTDTFSEKGFPTVELKGGSLGIFLGHLKRGGSLSVQKYAGKEVNNAQETIDYLVSVGNRAWGPTWLAEEAYLRYVNARDGIYVMSDLTAQDAEHLKSRLGGEFVLTAVLPQDKIDTAKDLKHVDRVMVIRDGSSEKDVGDAMQKIVNEITNKEK